MTKTGLAVLVCVAACGDPYGNGFKREQGQIVTPDAGLTDDAGPLDQDAGQTWDGDAGLVDAGCTLGPDGPSIAETSCWRACSVAEGECGISAEDAGSRCEAACWCESENGPRPATECDGGLLCLQACSDLEYGIIQQTDAGLRATGGLLLGCVDAGDQCKSGCCQ